MLKTAKTSSKTTKSTSKTAKNSSKKGHIPPQNVADNAAEGLELRQKFGHGGTRVGLIRARQLSKKQAVSDDIIQRIVSYFARHTVDKKGKDFYNKEKPSKGYIAWQLWGGDEGRDWAKKVKESSED